MKKQKLPPMAADGQPTAEASELKTITDFILTQFKIEKVICFGSIINNVQNSSCFKDAASEPEAKLQNSYYLLIIPEAAEMLADIAIQMRLEEDLKILANVTIIVHRMEEINAALENGSSFFTTIYKKGTMLYDQEKEAFVVPAPGAALNKRIIKREAFWHQWFTLSEGFLKGAVFFKNDHHHNLSVYMLHQALQHCYSGMLRVLTGYRTNANGLRRLMKLIDNILPDSSFTNVKKTPEDARLTGLLLKGFGDARYSDKFEITEQELSLMTDRIDEILKTANIACLQHIKKIKEGKTPYIA
ncbi:HEPN domain-containing protein [Pedobacter psychroterrae]|uniref:HEPN domain-containing protein n=1 Tax=Pedobacter psychroterrae TaxID=2530453 RepID=A0A4R0NUB3_9SPHI|nr:HEPN domain-containing protein [Pedobacter psychroterrae]TCD03573.1 HEPN domain-containing protein [Pedobacter psychroterrae]